MARKKIVEVKVPWPSALNPCNTPGHHRSAFWDVHGIVTKLCCDCVFDMEHKGMSRRDALKTFTPDPDGAIVLA